MRIAIVTGASAGLGTEFVRQLDATGEVDEIWMVARRREPMEALAATLTRAKPRVFAVDVTDRAALAAWLDTLDAEKPDLRWLVNNAGFGKVGPFAEATGEGNDGMIELNIRALVEITRRALPHCGPGTVILQVASSGGFVPLPYMAVYTATKAFVVHFSHALSAELAERGIRVTAVCPGPVRTEFFTVATDGARARPPVFEFQAADVVRHALAAGRRGCLNSITPWWFALAMATNHFVPRALLLWVARQWRWWKS